MKSPRLSTNSSTSSSFALISVLALVSLAALTATAFLASARLERQATMPLTQTTMLDMALDSGSVAALRLLETGAAEQFNYVVTYWRGSRASDWTNELGYLLIGSVQSNDLATNSRKVKYRFCFSSAALTNLATNLIEYKDEESAGNQEQFTRQIKKTLEATSTRTGTNFAAGQFTNIPLLGDTPANRFTSPPVGWVYINQDVRVKPGQTNTTNVPVARFAYYVQDLSSMIDADRMGGETNRSTGTNPAEISLTNLTATALIAPAKVDTLTASTNRPKYLSPGMLVLSDGGGLNTNDLRYVTTGLRHWTNAYERIPLGLGYSNWGTSDRGTNKYNLAINTNIDVDAIAAHITSNLTTNFLVRAGGLTNVSNGYTFDYAKCLAANIVDYIDTDSTPTYGSSGITNWCGVELAPVVTCAALATARTNCSFAANADSTPPAQLLVTESLTATLSLQFWNPYDKPTPATNNVPLIFRTCPPGSESTNGLAYVIRGNENTNIPNNGCYKHFETLFPDFKSTNINIPAIPPNSYALVEVSSTNQLTWTNLSASTVTTDTSLWGMKKGTTGPGTSTADIWRPVYLTYATNNDGIKMTRGELIPSTNPWLWSYTDHYSGGVAKPKTNNCWEGYLKIGAGGSLFSITNIYIKTGDLSEDNANRSCWYPNLRLSSGTLTDSDSSDQNSCVGTGDPRISYFARPTNNQPLYDSSPWPYGGNYASGLSWGGRAIVRQLQTTGDAVKTNHISTNNSVFPSASLATAPTTWLDSGHSDNPFGTNSPYALRAGADKPSAPTYASASNLFAKIPSSLWKTNQAPCHIANSPLTNICELGNIFDPIMWKRESQSVLGTNDTTNTNSMHHGGGNTLRLGRAEHPRFAWTKLGANVNDPSIPNMQMSAAALLDLFCLSNQFDEGGKINLNTAPAPVLRALAGGIYLRSDPNLTTGTATNPNYPIPPEMAEAFAQGVMRFRAQYPFYSPSQLAFINTSTNWSKDTNGVASIWPSNAVFGNTNTIFLVTNSVNTNTSTSLGITAWNDQAAEEWFAKIFSLSTVYSRNFRVYVIAQKATNQGGTNIGVGPVVRKYYNLLIRQRGVTNSSEPGAIPTISFQSYY